MLSELVSLDGTERAAVSVYRPDRYRHLFRELSTGEPAIPRGAGLSYCAASFGDGVRSVSSRLFNRILAFDPASGEVTVEPGLSVGELFRFAVANGRLPPVLPGHPAITVGGCVAFDVHGKSPYHAGCFADHVRELSVFHPDHGEVTCSPDAEPGLFELTAGGFGLTGFITRVTLRLAPLTGSEVHQRRVPAANLVDAVRVLESEHDAADSLYSWNDLNRRGPDFGRGMVYSERFAGDGVAREARFRSFGPPRRGPVSPALFRRPSAALFCRTYGWLESLKPREARLPLAVAAFPIHGKEIYYHLFGRRGLREYQMLIPRAAWESAAGELERLIATSGVGTTLGSLKLFEGRSSLLRFDGAGVCLAIDAPAGPRTANLFAGLDELVLRTGGRANLSKDSRLDGELARRIFPEYSRFREALEAHDPKRRFDSALRRRLGV